MKYTKIVFSIATTAILFIAMAPSFTFALDTVDNNITPSSTPAPAIEDNGSTASAISAPASEDNGSTALSASPAPTTQDNGSTARTISTPGTQDNGSTAGTVSAPVDTPATTGGVSVSSGGGSSSSSTGGSSRQLLTTIGQCNYISSYLKIGQTNSIDQVTRLQTFLRNTQGSNVDVTGIFDQNTKNAVSAFQTKYADEILAPWGVKKPTGFVYLTTQKKINELYCKASFALTPAQLAQIQTYRTSVKGSATPVSSEVGSKNPTPTTSTTPVDNSTETDSSQVATVAKTSVASKLWRFIKQVFGR